MPASEPDADAVAVAGRGPQAARPRAAVTKGVLYPAGSRGSVTIERYAASPDLAPLVRHYWIPRWSLPEGTSYEEQLLQYATCNIVVGEEYAAVFGISRGRGSRVLTGDGWAFGAMLQPGTARTLLGPDVPIERLATVPHPLGEGEPDGHGAGPAGAVRAAHEDDEQMIAAFETWLRGLDLDPEQGRLVNEIVAAVEGRGPGIRTVDDLAEHVGIGVRRLQRVTAEFVGMNPKWLLQRQRLQDAAERLREEPEGSVSLAIVAAELGYADQAHFSRDFAAAVGYSPREYARRTHRQPPASWQNETA
jgi:AraC-like DNA-binding protein